MKIKRAIAGWLVRLANRIHKDRQTLQEHQVVIREQKAVVLKCKKVLYDHEIVNLHPQLHDQARQVAQTHVIDKLKEEVANHVSIVSTYNAQEGGVQFEASIAILRK